VVDESATGSANFHGPASPPPESLGSRAVPRFHLPSIDQGVAAFIWAVLLGAFIWAGLLAVGASSATAIIIAVVSFFAIFVYVRLYGEDEPRRQPPARARDADR
jgi:hypothetical protein